MLDSTSARSYFRDLIEIPALKVFASPRILFCILLQCLPSLQLATAKTTYAFTKFSETPQPASKM